MGAGIPGRRRDKATERHELQLLMANSCPTLFFKKTHLDEVKYDAFLLVYLRLAGVEKPSITWKKRQQYTVNK